MFTSDMRESKQLCVGLPLVDAAELEALIRWSYSGSLSLSWGNVFEITSTALQLQFQSALSMCFRFLEQEIDVHFCLDVVSFAEAYGMLDLQEIANDFVLRHFQNVATTPKFQDLPVEKLRKYLKSNSLSVPSEIVVFNAVLAWIQACPTQRKELTEELMKNIYFPLMTFKEFKEVKKAKLWTENNMEDLYFTVLDNFCSYNDAPWTLCRVYKPKDTVILVGGDQLSSDLSCRIPSQSLWFVNSLRNYTGIVKNVEWKLLGEMPTIPRLGHEVAVLAGKLYVVGGQYYPGRVFVLNLACRYDPLQNSWEPLAEMQRKRCNFAMVVQDHMLYVIGGDTDAETNLDSVECYCPKTDSWSFAQPLDMTLSCHAATMLDDKIFISGGYHCRDQCLTSMFMYHTDRAPTYLAEMSQPRAYHCMEALNGHIYVAGGVTTNVNMTSDQLACEFYNPVTDTWCAFTTLHIPHVGAASVVLEGKFYVLGGYCNESYKETRLVHRYDPTTHYWQNMGKMPGPNNDTRACLLQLPAHLRH
ncbi:hypothetical protein UPYG_G00237080 [Umbra pygmaea]|uniref:BACK domain-containing protein n=1 Tax=Umbra pygmaea TaxID=75934 RepID=A0ABD0WEJ7_UMBPY